MNWLTVVLAAVTAGATYIPPIYGIPVGVIVTAVMTAVAHALPSPSGQSVSNIVPLK